MKAKKMNANKCVSQSKWIEIGVKESKCMKINKMKVNEYK